MSSQPGLLGAIAASAIYPAGASSTPSSHSSTFRPENHSGSNSSATTTSASAQGPMHNSFQSFKAFVAKCVHSDNSLFDIESASCSSISDESEFSKSNSIENSNTSHHSCSTTALRDVRQPATVGRAGSSGSMLMNLILLCSSSLGPMLHPVEWCKLAQCSSHMSYDINLLGQDAS